MPYPLIIALFLQLFDAMLTQISLNLGVSEWNPLYGEHPTLFLLTSIKIMACVSLVFIYYKLKENECVFLILNTIMLSIIMYHLSFLIAITKDYA